MAITKTAAKIFVAKILGLQNDASALALAGDSIDATYRKWNALNKWDWCLRDTAAGFTVAACVIPVGGLIIPAPSTGAFDAINLDVAVTGTGVAASTTVSSYTRDSSGHVATLTLSVAATPATVTLTFAGNIPLRAGTEEYNIPLDFRTPYNATLLTNKRLLEYVQYREWNLKIVDHTAQGVPEQYTMFNPLSEGTQGYTRLRFRRIPAVADTVYLQYFRSLSTTATNIDVIDDYLSVFLLDARVDFLGERNANDDRLPALMHKLERALNRITADDTEKSDDEDARMISQNEIFGDTDVWGWGGW